MSAAPDPSRAAGNSQHLGQEPPIVRDRRRVDPVTGQLRQPVGAASQAAPQAEASGAEESGAEGDRGGGDGDGDAARLEALQAEVAERTGDLQRLQAEYANYRRRVDRDRELVREMAVTTVLGGLVPVLDDVGRAREHGELVGGFRSVAEALEAVTAKAGLQRFGEPGEPFDPTVHEALTHSYSSDVPEATCVAVLQPGYRVGARVIRPARVAVAEPEPLDPSGPAGSPAEDEADRSSDPQ